jgi:hypothetical protein
MPRRSRHRRIIEKFDGYEILNLSSLTRGPKVQPQFVS